MPEIDDGGPAFLGTLYGQSGSTSYAGMSLRDYFAGQIIAGRMINGHASSADAKVHARVAYEIADAMIAERKKTNG